MMIVWMDGWMDAHVVVTLSSFHPIQQGAIRRLFPIYQSCLQVPLADGLFVDYSLPF